VGAYISLPRPICYLALLRGVWAYHLLNTFFAAIVSFYGGFFRFVGCDCTALLGLVIRLIRATPSIRSSVLSGVFRLVICRLRSFLDGVPGVFRRVLRIRTGFVHILPRSLCG